MEYSSGFQIRAHHFFHAADAREFHELVNIGSFPASIEPQGFEDRIEPELIPILEAVGQRLFRTVDAKPDAIHLVRFDAFRERAACKPKHAERRMLESRRLGTARQRNVDFMRNLGGNLVVSEGRDEADHSGGNLQRDGYEVGIAERGEVCQTVEAATKLFDDALVAHVVQCARMDSSTQRGASPKKATLLAKKPPLSCEGCC